MKSHLLTTRDLLAVTLTMLLFLSVVICVGAEAESALGRDPSSRQLSQDLAPHMNEVPESVKSQQTSRVEFVPDRVIVKLSREAPLELSTRVRSGIDPTELDAVLADQRVLTSTPLFGAVRPEGSRSGQKARDLVGLDRIYIVQLERGSDVRGVARVLSADPGIEYAEPDYIAHQIEIPDDPRYTEQWALNRIQVEEAWQAVPTAPGVLIAILDSGIDVEHPDLQPNLWANPGEIAANGLDDDANGYVDDTLGWNFVYNNNDIADDNGHGSLVSGIAAARTGNSLGIAGVCGRCRIMPVKVMQPSGAANYSAIAAGITYAVDKGARIVNLSLGGYSDSSALRDALEYASTQNAVVVAGAGNDNTGVPFYPAAYDNVTAVAGTSMSDTRSASSNYGAWVDVSAPSEDILTTAMGSDYVTTSGTSMASPFAAGLAGLLVSLHPDWAPALVHSQMVHTADPIDALNPGFESKLGSGRINAARAVQSPVPDLSHAGYSVDGVEGGRPDFGTTANLAVAVYNGWADAHDVVGTLTTTDPLVTVATSLAEFGDIFSGQTVASSTPYSIVISGEAAYAHPISFDLVLSADSGLYTTTQVFTVTTRSSVEYVTGTIYEDTVWTGDKTYVVNANVGVAPGCTLTIEPGTSVKFNGDYSLNVGGQLIASGTPAQPIIFMPYSSNTWNRIYFDNSMTDAIVDAEGNYQSGTLLRYAQVKGAAGGLACSSATPYLAYLTTDGGGINCILGDGSFWLLDSAVTGNVYASGPGRVRRSTINNGALSLGTASDVLTSMIGKGIALGENSRVEGSSAGAMISLTSGDVVSSTVIGGGISSGSGSIGSNQVVGGSISLTSGQVTSNTVRGGGIAVGDGCIVEANDIEDAPSAAIQTTGTATVLRNRVVASSGPGIVASTGLVQGNLVADAASDGLRVGAATVVGNTLTGIAGRSIYVSGGIPLEIAGNNFAFNSGPYDLYNDNPYGQNITADSNWWGTVDVSLIGQRVYDFYDDYNLGKIIFAPMLESASTAAPAYVQSITLTPPSPVGLETATFAVGFSRPMDAAIRPVVSFTSGYGQIEKAAMICPREDLGVAALTDGTIYAIGGGGRCPPDCSPAPNCNEHYDPALDLWSPRAPMPHGRVYLAATATHSDKVLAIGGHYNEALSLVEEYDPDADSWTTRADMPTPRSQLAAVTGKNGKIYAIGGSATGGAALAVVEEYDPTTGVWISRSPMPTARYALAAVVADTGRIYAIGGFNAEATLEEYDPTTDSWVQRADLIAPRSALAAAFASNGRIYVLGGWAAGAEVATVAEYDPSTDQWSMAPSMLRPRVRAGAAAADGGRVFVIGGYNAATGGAGTAVGPVLEYSVPFERRVDGLPQWTRDSEYRASYDFDALVARGVYTLKVAGARDVAALEIAPSRSFTFTLDYAGSVSDRTAPTPPTVFAQITGTVLLSAHWSSSDPESSITSFRYAVGTAPGRTEVINWTALSSTEVVRSGLSLTDGQTYYLSVQARNEAGLWSESAVSNGVTAVGAPIVAGRRSDPDVVLFWSHLGDHVASYEVYRSTQPYFSRGDPGVVKVADVPAPSSGGEVACTDSNALAPPATDYFYGVLAVGTDGQLSVISSYDGVFTFAMEPGTS